MGKLLAFARKCDTAIKQLNVDSNKSQSYLMPIDYATYEKRYHEVRYMRTRGGYDTSTPWSPSLRSSMGPTPGYMSGLSQGVPQNEMDNTLRSSCDERQI